MAKQHPYITAATWIATLKIAKVRAFFEVLARSTARILASPDS
ncbi:hypothetical protein ART_2039 [Arthrobacter sp. PAMC 25486]|nr:hypothetical protein ART_2039 [Arthrobacter sp. PAMC 25486]